LLKLQLRFRFLPYLTVTMDIWQQTAAGQQEFEHADQQGKGKDLHTSPVNLSVISNLCSRTRYSLAFRECLAGIGTIL
jgi:hypothetical protein